MSMYDDKDGLTCSLPPIAGPSNEPFIDLICSANSTLPGFISSAVDGGAGIGDTIEPLLASGGLRGITAYEPLPENANVLRERFGSTPSVDIRELAISNKQGMARFVVPSRIGANAGAWRMGTSYGGYVLRGWVGRALLRRLRLLLMDAKRLVSNHGLYQTLNVKTVRLDEDLPAAPDAVKLDLQGGEASALQGLGERLSQVKLVKVEVQMLRAGERRRTVKLLQRAGFAMFPESLQFSIVNLDKNLRKRLADSGVVIKRVISGTVFDPQTMVLGDWQEEAALPFDGFEFKPGFTALLKEARTRYFQIDVIALNRLYADSWNRIVPGLKLQKLL